MAYEKHQWQNGEIINATKLNHIEDGIEGNTYNLVTITWHQDTETYTSNITSWDELQAVVNSPKLLFVKFEDIPTYEGEDLYWDTLRPLLVTQVDVGEDVFSGNIPCINYALWTLGAAMCHHREGQSITKYFYLTGLSGTFTFDKSTHELLEVNMEVEKANILDTLNI